MDSRGKIDNNADSNKRLQRAEPLSRGVLRKQNHKRVYKMRFIQVGVGGFGRGWVQRLTDNQSVEVVALVDVNQTALTAARKIGKYGKKICFSRLSEALKKVKADSLVCVTPPEYHKQCVVQAMKAGLDVITEKPMFHGGLGRERRKLLSFHWSGSDGM